MLTRFCLSVQIQYVWPVILKFLVNTLSKSQIYNLQYITGEIKTVIKYSNVKMRSQLHENAISYFVVHDNLSLSILYWQMMT